MCVCVCVCVCVCACTHGCECGFHHAASHLTLDTTPIQFRLIVTWKALFGYTLYRLRENIPSICSFRPCGHLLLPGLFLCYILANGSSVKSITTLAPETFILSLSPSSILSSHHNTTPLIPSSLV